MIVRLFYLIALRCFSVTFPKIFISITLVKFHNLQIFSHQRKIIIYCIVYGLLKPCKRLSKSRVGFNRSKEYNRSIKTHSKFLKVTHRYCLQYRRRVAKLYKSDLKSFNDLNGLRDVINRSHSLEMFLNRFRSENAQSKITFCVGGSIDEPREKKSRSSSW